MRRRFTDADLPIETARLTLRRFREEDAASLLELYGNPDVVRYLYMEPLQPDGLRDALDRRLRPPQLDAEGDVLELAAELRSAGQFVGAMTFFYRSTVHARGEIGYTIAPQYAGQGFATEGAVAMLRIGFEVLGLHRLEGQCDARNLGSARVLERIGMRREAHFLENEFVKGEWTDAHVFAMLADEWLPQIQRSEQAGRPSRGRINTGGSSQHRRVRHDQAVRPRRMGRRSSEQTTVTRGPGTAQVGSPVTTQVSNRPTSPSSMMRISRLASAAPRQ